MALLRPLSRCVQPQLSSREFLLPALSTHIPLSRSQYTSLISRPHTSSQISRTFTVIGTSVEGLGRSSSEHQGTKQHTEPGTTATTTPSQPLTSGTSVLIRTTIFDLTSHKDETIVRHLSYNFTTQTEFDRFLDRSQSSGLCEAEAIQNGDQHVAVVTQLSELQDNVLYVNINAACVTC